jgi:hypothetical protein
MIDFDTVLPAESVGDEYYTIATKKAGDILKVGNQHRRFYGTLKDAKAWFYDVISEAYMHKVERNDDGELEGLERGDVKFEHDSKIVQLVLAYEARF